MKYYIKNLAFLLFISVCLSQTNISGLSNKDLDLIKKQLNVPLITTDNQAINDESVKSELVSIKSQDSSDGGLYFGYNFFKKNINFYDNVPTPPDFRLGPGDEIVLSLWGETNIRERFTINKNGLIYYEKIGFINLLNKTLEEAEIFLRKELAVIYSTLDDKDNQTELMLELGKIKSINIYFTGHVNNIGINLIHPFSDIFSALIQAGGVNKNGSLRNVQLIRNDKIIATFDFYSFFISGNNIFSKNRIIEGDIIHVPTVNNRIQIIGAVRNPGYYESIEGESFKELLNYAGGLDTRASSSAVIQRLIPLSERITNDDVSKSINTSIVELLDIFPNDGDSINIIPLVKNDNMVLVTGAVKTPGLYSSDSSLKEILDIAGGFNDPEFYKSIYPNVSILRKDESQDSSLFFEVLYSDSDSFMMSPGDKVIVYKNQNYNSIPTISIDGEVNKVGNFLWQEGMTVKDVISLAGGFTKHANPDGVLIKQIFTSFSNSSSKTTNYEQMLNTDINSTILPGAKITIMPYEDVVKVVGNVYMPGFIEYNGGTLNQYIEYAGGKKQKTKSNRIFITRINGEIKKVKLFRGRLIKVKPGDIITVPTRDESDFNISSFIADVATTLANIAAIIAISDRASN